MNNLVETIFIFSFHLLQSPFLLSHNNFCDSNVK